MEKQIKPHIYRQVIDDLVEMCHNGQGQIGSVRVREGLWNINANKEFFPDQYEINLFLARMTVSDREILARMLASAVETGVFETLKVLEQYEIKPFEDGYEGSPYNDFIGRLDDWEWPETHLTN
jgi:hypothetical protein